MSRINRFQPEFGRVSGRQLLSNQGLRDCGSRDCDVEKGFAIVSTSLKAGREHGKSKGDKNTGKGHFRKRDETKVRYAK